MSGPALIAHKNDLYRRSLSGCQVMLTASLADHPMCQEVLAAVRAFDSFNSENDPYGEHDFGIVEVAGERFYFKFDYYDKKYEFYEEGGLRVLTIGLAEEY